MSSIACWRARGEIAREQRLEWVDVHFVPTNRNQPASSFLESLGSGFKQPLNGGYVFRFPTGFAAEVAFHPPAAQVRIIGGSGDEEDLGTSCR